MKKLFLVLFIMMQFAFGGCEEDSDSESFLYNIPSEIQAYVDQHFPDQSVIQARLDLEGTESNYELLLDNFIKLEFNVEKAVVEIDSNVKLPDSVIPANILAYITSNYKDYYITCWELKSGHQQIELNNQVELDFDLEGQFLRLDN